MIFKDRLLNSMTFQVFHDLYEPWKYKLTITSSKVNVRNTKKKQLLTFFFLVPQADASKMTNLQGISFQKWHGYIAGMEYVRSSSNT